MLKISIILLVALSAVCYAELLVGGHQKMDLKDPELPKLIEFAVSKINEETLSKGLVSLLHATNEIIKAESQVVAGMNYFLTFKAKDSNGTDKECSVVIYHVPWLDSKKITSWNC